MIKWIKHFILLGILIKTSVKCTYAFSLPSFTTYTKTEEVLDLIQKSDIIYKDEAYKISILETGKYKSTLYKINNNTFGFKKNKRKIYQSTTSSGYCKYKNLSDSVLDYELWEKEIIKKYKIRTKKQFLNYIARKYSKTPNYISRLKRIKV